MIPKFEYYEKVKVLSKDPQKTKLRDQLGAVLGRLQKESGDWDYAVHIYASSEVWHFDEDELVKTGEFDVRESFYPGDSIRITVDPKGKGRLKKDD